MGLSAVVGPTSTANLVPRRPCVVGCITVWVVGLGSQLDERLPQPVDAGPFTQVAAGDVHSAAVAVDGTIWMWGRGTRGALGLGGNMKNALVPEQVMSLRVAFT